jgi:hypothetical protein
VVSAANFGRFVLGLLAVLSTAVLIWFAAGLYPFWPLLWFVPLPVLLFANRASWWGTLLTAALAWFLGSLNVWRYYQEALELPPD